MGRKPVSSTQPSHRQSVETAPALEATADMATAATAMKATATSAATAAAER
jgi:hypothetical protein